MIHDALENITHKRKRSSVSPHNVQQIQADPEPEMDPENKNSCTEIDDVFTHPTALN
ncbi:hypothetical protein HPG69_019775 [Diceros bicornis minor]|uniref:Uncharacterized protein n=1 Tax=Diceros bicornis minor TaxID=77932 RepID=A0A7J7EQB7_DICBM|nr:hypothetical protein HPG69_019775 [Diceros bicornis minor]